MGINDELSKYQGDNRYLTNWEKQMKKDIEKIVEGEINTLAEIEKADPWAVKCFSTDARVCEIYRNRMKSEYEVEYRDNYTLKLLKQCGLDTDAFLKTWMGICSRSSILLGCIQDKIDGFYYNDYGERISNNHPLDLNNVTIIYKDGVLTIKDDEVSYDFYVDEHQIVYVNGENVLNLVEIPTNEEEDKMIRDMMENIRLNLLNRDRKLEKTLEYDKNKS